MGRLARGGGCGWSGREDGGMRGTQTRGPVVCHPHPPNGAIWMGTSGHLTKMGWEAEEGL